MFVCFNISSYSVRFSMNHHYACFFVYFVVFQRVFFVSFLTTIEFTLVDVLYNSLHSLHFCECVQNLNLFKEIHVLSFILVGTIKKRECSFANIQMTLRKGIIWLNLVWFKSCFTERKVHDTTVCSVRLHHIVRNKSNFVTLRLHCLFLFIIFSAGLSSRKAFCLH